jgi:predicted dehydrogenase
MSQCPVNLPANESVGLSAALVGFGSVALNAHIPWYLGHPGVQLVAVVEPTSRGRTLARSVLPKTPVFESLNGLLRSLDVNFVDITAPPREHAKLILAAVAAELDVFCEKPFVTSLQELQQIEVLRQHSASVIAPCHNWYYAPAIRRGIEMVESGVLGEPQRVQFEARRSRAAQGAPHWRPDWRELGSEGGGIISDLGYHGIYLASRIFNTQAVSVIAKATLPTTRFDAAERSADLQLNYGKGRIAELHLSWADHERKTRLCVTGTRGHIVIDNASVRVDSPDEMTETSFESLVADSWHAAWTGETLDRFVEAIRSRRVDGPWREIQWCISALDAAYASARLGIYEAD